MSLRRGISLLIGGSFERLFCPEGREFEQANLHKFKCPDGGGGAMLKVRFDGNITRCFWKKQLHNNITKLNTIMNETAAKTLQKSGLKLTDISPFDLQTSSGNVLYQAVVLSIHKGRVSCVSCPVTHVKV